MIGRLVPCLAVALLIGHARADVPMGGLAEAPVRAAQGEARGLVFLFSDADGPDASLEATARRLADQGLATVTIDSRDYLRRVAATKDADCLYLVSEIEAVSQAIQARNGRGIYHSPIVAGAGLGGTLALLALAQAPAATLAGAVSEGFSATLELDRPLCPTEEAEWEGAGYHYRPPASWPGFVRIAAPAADLEAARLYAAHASDATIVEAGPDVGIPSLLADTADVEAHVGGLEDLPLVELPVEEAGRRFAIVISGDGGWRDIDKDLAATLQADGVPTVGVDALRYFWSEKPPERLAADLARIIDHYRTAWSRPEVLLIGYSFGADVMPFAVNRLPPDTRAAVHQVSLLAPSTWANFEIHLSGWLVSGPFEDSVPTLPELARLDMARLQCFWGEEDEGSVCPDPALKGAELVQTTGGHHFDGDYEALARTILDGADRRG